MEPYGVAGGVLYLIVGLLGLILTVIWICLPFAIFGIKPRLDQINGTLQMILVQLRRNAGEPAQLCPPHDFQPSPNDAKVSICTRCLVAVKDM
jgi:hypothetical protein